MDPRNCTVSVLDVKFAAGMLGLIFSCNFQHQAEAIIGDAVASEATYARKMGKPIVIEQLDFRQV